MRKPDIVYGVINIFYRKRGEEFLLVKNTKTSNMTFVSGASEDVDKDLKETAQREIKEELGLDPGKYELIPTPVKQEFVFNTKKTERAGKKGEYRVFLVNATGLTIPHTKELSEIVWADKSKVPQLLTFDDLKPVFSDAIRYIRP